MNSDLLARIATGGSPRREMKFSFGKPSDPFSLGSAGHWQISGAGVRPIHAFLHFDGEAICILSADDDQPARLNNVAVPRKWTRVPIPSVVTLGSASIMVGATSDEPVTHLITLQKSEVALNPLLALASTETQRLGPRPSSGPMFRAKVPVPPRPPSPTVIVQDAPVPVLKVEAPAHEVPTLTSKNKARQARIRRIALGVTALGLVLLLAFSYGRDLTAAHARSAPQNQPGAAAPRSNVAAALGPTSASGSSTVPSDAPVAKEALAESGELSGGVDERAAAEAVAHGESDLALAAYTKLAQARPDVHAFVVARDILARKSSAAQAGR